MFGYEEELQDEIAKLKAENEKLKLRLSVVSQHSELLISFSEYLHTRDLLNVVKENIPLRVKLFLKKN